jgi:hypothetical protein
MPDEQPQTPELNPPHGGRWLRDPHTGALTPLPPTDDPPAAPGTSEEE